MREGDSDRRLAAILAVDMAGYSRRAEADQAAAVQAVTALSQLVHGVAAGHGGRVFNAAGDGFMLEFPTASGALEAAADLAARAQVPVRIGVHLGDIHQTPSGDLLGHGVNVAARLQALAEPGAILVSDDVRRAARGPLADQLSPQGGARLDKMREKARIYALRPPGAPPRRALRRSRPRALWAAGGAAAIAVLGAGGFWIAQSAQAQPTPLKTAVADFVVQGAVADPAFGVATADRVAAALGERQSPTVSRDLSKRGKTAGARLLVGGEISRDGDNLRIHAHIDDAKAGVVLWAADFERPLPQSDAAQDATATKVADLIDLVRRDVAEAHATLSADSLSALLRAEDVSRLAANESGDAKRAAWRQVIGLTPRLASAHAALAYFDLNDMFAAPPPPSVRDQRVAEAQAEVKIALALDPHDGAAYVAGSLLPRPSELVEQEDWLLRGLAVDPGNSTLNYNEADLSREAGRLNESLSLTRRSLDADPLSRSKNEALVFGLIAAGRTAQARSLNDRVRRTWSDYATAQVAQLTLDLIYGDQVSGESALAAAERGELPLTRGDIAAWRKVLAARAGRAPSGAAARALVDAAIEDRQFDLGLEVSALAQLGQIDLAFAELDRGIDLNKRFFMSTVYEPALANLRRSPKFMPFAARHGLTRYWLRTGRWPDFCAEPGLPYNCQDAARAGATGGGGPGSVVRG